MTWQTPPNTIGTNLGWIIDDPDNPGSPTFESNPDAPTNGSGQIIASDCVVNCTNRFGSKIEQILQYEVTGSESSTYSQTGRNMEGTSTFLVIDPGVANPVPAAVTIEIFAWLDGGTQPVEPLKTVTVECPQVPLPEVDSVDIWEESGGPHGPIAIAVTEDSSTYPLNFVNRTSQSIDVWLNGRTTAERTIEPGQETASPIDVSSGDGQWILGFTNGDDPSIVIRRPPMRTE